MKISQKQIKKILDNLTVIDEVRGEFNLPHRADNDIGMAARDIRFIIQDILDEEETKDATQRP